MKARPPAHGRVHVLLKIDGPGSNGELLLKDLTSLDVAKMRQICVLWNEENQLHAQPTLSLVEVPVNK